MKARGCSNAEIARTVEKDVSTIGREIGRNSYDGKHYAAINAKMMADKRKKKARERHPLKDAVTYNYVITKLRKGWSPEQISGRLELQAGEKVISYETIYRFVYAEENKGRAFWEYLPRKHKKRRKRGGRKVQRSRIPDRVSIHERPEKVDKREEFGHWESDSVESNRSSLSGVHTEVERISRKYLVKKLERITARETLEAQQKMFGGLPQPARKSTTADNGVEFVEHVELKKCLGTQTYFADPYSSFQRGSNEHHNGLLRRYYPKGTDFSEVTREELDAVVAEINNRPRKCLGYNTPNEVFAENLKGLHF